MQYQTNNGTIYLLDHNGHEIFIGDYVKCIVDHYQGVKYNQHRRVQGFDGSNIVLFNPLSPSGFAPYKPDNFIIYSKNHPAHRRYDYMFANEVEHNKKDEPMVTGSTLQVAVLIPDGMNKEEFIDFMSNSSFSERTKIIAKDSPHKLKEALKHRIHEFTDERWFIVNTQQIAEAATPPISIRNW